MDVTNHEDKATSKLHSFLLTNFEPKFHNPKHLLIQVTKYLPRSQISEIVPTRNGMIIKSQDDHLATIIRNKVSFEIFVTNAYLTKLTAKTIRQQPPPRKTPTLSVVIKGVNPYYTDEEVTDELKAEGHDIVKCLRIRNNN